MQQILDEPSEKSKLLTLPSKGHYTLSFVIYYVVKQIGKGGFANVILAIEQFTKSQVAIKVIPKNEPDIQGSGITDREILIQSRLRHPNIVQIIEIFQDANNKYIVQEFCSKGDLLTRLQNQGPLTLDQANRILSQIIQAMLYMHQHYLYHRDIKPQNIVIDSQNKAKLCDFGMACENKQGINLTEYCGSPSYMSPQIAMKIPYNPLQSDIWSLGVTYHAMLTGEMLFYEQTGKSAREKIINYDYQLPWSILPRYRPILKMMLSKASNRASLSEIWKTIPSNSNKQTLAYDSLDIIYNQKINQSVINRIKYYTKKQQHEILSSIELKKFNKDYALYFLLNQKKNKGKPNKQKRSFSKKKGQTINLSVQKKSKEFSPAINNVRLISDNTNKDKYQIPLKNSLIYRRMAKTPNISQISQKKKKKLSEVSFDPMNLTKRILITKETATIKNKRGQMITRKTHRNLKYLMDY